MAGPSRAKKITLDSQGRMIDDQGKIIEIEKHVELKINQKLGATQPKVLDGAINSNSIAATGEKEQAQ